LRHMIASDRRFLLTDDKWIASWASRFGTDAGFREAKWCPGHSSNPHCAVVAQR
jgi:hypothetical protein